MNNKKQQLDQEYNKYEKQLKNDYNSIPILRQKLEELQNLIIHYKNNIGKLNNIEINDYHEKLNEIENIETKISNIENESNLMKYYIKNGNILNKYYNNLENPSDNINRTDLLNEYLINNDPHYVQILQPDNHNDLCSNCNVYREVMTAESHYVCPNCGEQADTIVECDKPSYKDPQQENVHFEYQRLIHCKDHLARIQAKESTQIPEIVFDIIRVEFAKSGRTNLAELNEIMVKNYLKKYIKLGLNKYYENVHKIIYKLTGIQPVVFPIEVEEQLCSMFMKIEEPFENNRPKERRNLISYPYVLYKLCQLLGYTEYLKYFNLLKSTSKLFEQDKIWKKICINNGWTYYPSVRQ